jgi:hypothetical protein
MNPVQQVKHIEQLKHTGTVALLAGGGCGCEAKSIL